MNEIEKTFIRDCRKFYDKQGYLPWKMAEVLLKIAEKEANQ